MSQFSTGLREYRPENDRCPYCGQGGGFHEKCRLEWEEKDPEGLERYYRGNRLVLFVIVGGIFLLFIGIIAYKLASEIFSDPKLYPVVALVTAGGFINYKASRGRGNDPFTAIGSACIGGLAMAFVAFLVGVNYQYVSQSIMIVITALAAAVGCASYRISYVRRGNVAAAVGAAYVGAMAVAFAAGFAALWLSIKS
jgi:hypothetical protein